ncbi:hypothetical protein BKI51_02535 [Alphaproteobacteria bacterium AO1-B]|nr:hypothetical protein BKI51_02535 [Alphaproteobacteria bacterium AO1-B]
MAIVEVRNGEVFAECHDAPGKVRSATGSDQKLFLRNWALSVITREDRSLSETITHQELEILRSQKYEYINEDGFEVIVQFRLPRLQSRGGSEAFAE